jgi:ABC-type branched-subunit amino acid transport system ATPase component
MLEITSLEVAYGAIRVLDGIDVAVAPGEMVALLGTNGAGKSTVLKAVSGLLPIKAGSIRFEGIDITGASPEDILSAGVGQVPGGRGLIPSLTVEENLRLGGHLLPKAALAEAMAEASEPFPWMAERRKQMAGTLSGGEQQMLAIARALVARPRLLMVDELSLGLAPAVVADLIGLLGRLRAERGIAILLVEQHVTMALSVTERAYFLERGKVRFAGPSGELAGRDDLLRSVFLEGAPAERRREALERLG